MSLTTRRGSASSSRRGSVGGFVNQAVRAIETAGSIASSSLGRRSRGNIEIDVRPKRRKSNDGNPKRAKRVTIRQKATERQPQVKGSRKVKKSKSAGTKVSKKLRAKIKKVLAVPEYRGTLHQNFTFADAATKIYYIDANADQQVVMYYVQQAPRDIFSPARFLDAASFLWNRKAKTTSPTIGDAGNFDPNATQIHIVNSWFSCEFYNNSQRQYTLNLWDVYPKTMSGDTNQDPINAWIGALTQEALAEGQGGNVSGMLNSALRSKPTFTAQWKQLFRMDEKKVVLEAGQSYTHFIQGPRDMKLDLAKTYSNGVLQFNQKYVCYPVVAYWANHTATDTNAEGHFGEGASLAVQNGHGVRMDQQFHYELGMPEQVGFTYPAAFAGSTGQTLNRRHTSYAVSTFSMAKTGVIHEIDELNPVSEEVGPV